MPCLVICYHKNKKAVWEGRAGCPKRAKRQGSVYVQSTQYMLTLFTYGVDTNTTSTQGEEDSMSVLGNTRRY